MARRVRAVLALTYLAVLVAIAFWPAPVDADLSGVIGDVVAWCRQHGLPFVTYSFIERAANVVLFVPLGAIAAGVLSSAPTLAVASCVALSLAFEFGQSVMLPDRFPSLVDVVCNAAGAALGGIWVTARDRRTRSRRKTAWS